jgi:DNA-binding protein Fis
MVKIINVYLIPTSYINKEEVELLLRQQLQVELELYFNKDNIGELTIYGSSDLIGNLYTFSRIMESDFATPLLIVMVPRFDDNFLKLIKESPVKSGVYSAYDLLIKLNYINNYQFPDIFNEIDKELLDTARAFIECGLNASAASRMLYIHRNTFNYRLKKFIDITKIDIRLVNNAFFVYLLLSR